MRVIIVEDNNIILHGLMALFEEVDDIELLGAYETGEEALPEILEQKPDIVLTDIGLPEMSGVQLIAEVKKVLPDMKFVVHTIFEDSKTVYAALKAGAAGYILKSGTSEDIISILYYINGGGAILSPKIALNILNEFKVSTKNGDPEGILTPDEIQVLTKFSRAMTYLDIASAMNISIYDVIDHVKNVYAKLQAKYKDKPIE